MIFFYFNVFELKMQNKTKPSYIQNTTIFEPVILTGFYTSHMENKNYLA